jgi:hypothetical protein
MAPGVPESRDGAHRVEREGRLSGVCELTRSCRGWCGCGCYCRASQGADAARTGRVRPGAELGDGRSSVRPLRAARHHVVLCSSVALRHTFLIADATFLASSRTITIFAPVRVLPYNFHHPPCAYPAPTPRTTLYYTEMMRGPMLPSRVGLGMCENLERRKA